MKTTHIITITHQGLAEAISKYLDSQLIPYKHMTVTEKFKVDDVAGFRIAITKQNGKSATYRHISESTIAAHAFQAGYYV